MTPSPARTFLHNVNLLVRDPAASRAFYADVFGLVLDERRSAAPAMLLLLGPDGGSGASLTLKDRATEDPAKLAGPGDIELGFSTADLEGCHARLGAYGTQRSPILTLGFGRTFDAQDPDGHHLSVYELAPENR